MPEDDKLSEAPRNEEIELTELRRQEAADERREAGRDLAVAKEVAAAVASVVEQGLHVEPPSALVVGEDLPNVNEPLINPEPDPEDSHQRASLDRVQREQAKASQEDRDYNVARWTMIWTAVGAVAAGLGVLIGSVYTLYLAIQGAESGNPDPALPPAVNKAVRTLVELFGTGQDGAFWKRLADYVDADARGDHGESRLTLGDQVLFMRYTIDLWPDTGGWMWDTATDRAHVVTDLVGAYQARQSISDMYRLVTTYTALNGATQQQVMPRAIAAKQLAVALAVIGSLS